MNTLRKALHRVWTWIEHIVVLHEIYSFVMAQKILVAVVSGALSALAVHLFIPLSAIGAGFVVFGVGLALYLGLRFFEPRYAASSERPQRSQGKRSLIEFAGKAKIGKLSVTDNVGIGMDSILTTTPGASLEIGTGTVAGNKIVATGPHQTTGGPNDDAE